MTTKPTPIWSKRYWLYELPLCCAIGVIVALAFA